MAGKCYRRADEKVPKRAWPAHFGAGRTVHLSRHEMEFVMEKTKAYQVFVDGGLVSQSEALDAVYEDLMELRHAEAFVHNAANQERESGNSPALLSYVVPPGSRSKGFFKGQVA